MWSGSGSADRSVHAWGWRVAVAVDIEQPWEAARGAGGDGHEDFRKHAGKLSKNQGFRLQANNQKTRGGSQHPDRDAQFAHINQTVAGTLADGQPTVSIDCKKKELFGDHKAVGREWEPTGRPVEVQGHDFPTGVPKAVPYGIYDITNSEGYVSVGRSAETAVLAQQHPRVVGAPRQRALPERDPIDDPCGLRRQEQPPHASVECRAAALRR